MKRVNKNLYRMTVCLTFSVIFIVNALRIEHLSYFLIAVAFAAIAAMFAIRARNQFAEAIRGRS